MSDIGTSTPPGTMDVLAKAFLDPGAHRASLPLLADLVRDAGRPAEALMLLDRYHRTGPDAAGSRLTEAAVRARLSGPAATVAPLRRAVRLDPTAPAPARALMQVLARLGQRREAADVLAGILPWVDDPGEAVALLAAGRPGWQSHGRCDAQDGLIRGWLAWRGGGARRDLVIDAGGRELRVGVTAGARTGSRAEAGGGARIGSFAFPWPGAAASVIVRDAQTGEALAGSPLANEAAFPAEPTLPDDGGVTVIVPVHGDGPATARCLDSLLRATGTTPHRILVVDDASPVPAIVRLLDRLAREGRICLIRNPANIGFVRAVNRALAHVPGGDVVLLNADTVVPPGWLDRLAAAAREPGVGTVTPLSNNGELVSVPRPFAPAPLGSDDAVEAIDRFVARAVAEEGLPVAIDLPNGVGFCLYVTQAARAAVGPLDAGLYRRGYLEEVDWCLRIRAAGFRNVCAPGVFVGHEGSVSFGEEKRALVRLNARTLAHRWPAIHGETDAFVAADPLARLRARPEWLELRAAGSRLAIVAARRSDADRLRRLAAAQRPAQESAKASAQESAQEPALVLSPADDGRLEVQGEPGWPWMALEGAAPTGEALGESLARAGVSRLLYADWGSLDGDVLARLAACGLPHDLLAVDASAVVAPGRSGAAGATATTLVTGAERVLCPSPMALRALVTGWPALQPRMVLSDTADPPPFSRTIRAEPTHLGVLVPGDDAQTHALLAALALALAARRSRVRLVVIGATADDVALMRGPGLFVAGPAQDAASVMAAVDSHACARLLILFRGASFGHHALAAAAAAGLPCAGWRHGDAAAILGEGADQLALPDTLSVAALAEALDGWMLPQPAAATRVA